MTILDMAKRGRPKRVVPTKAASASARKVTVEENLMSKQVSSDGFTETLDGKMDELGLGDKINGVTGEKTATGEGSVRLAKASIDGVSSQEKSYLLAVQGGLVSELVSGNRDPRRGCKLFNEENRDEDLVFTFEDMVEERLYWANALIGNVLGDRIPFSAMN
ncbi:hypothetical protein Dimus_025103, partial [Dionaea muscipula]